MNKKAKIIIAGVIAAVALGIVTTVVISSKSQDSGIAACQKMKSDEARANVPTEAEQATELRQLRNSGNAMLRQGAEKLSSADEDIAFSGVADLYTGCAQLGINLRG